MMMKEMGEIFTSLEVVNQMMIIIGNPPFGNPPFGNPPFVLNDEPDDEPDEPDNESDDDEQMIDATLGNGGFIIP